jgi:hypothetical protein
VLPGCAGKFIPILVTVVLCGCGGSEQELPRAKVSGHVTLDGKPLPEGVIRFIPTGEAQGPKTSAVIAEGRFLLEEEQGPVVGTHRIIIESTDNGGYAPDDEEAIPRLRASGVKRINVVRVPAIYNSRSTLTETVSTEGPNEFTFDLKSKAAR